MQSRDPEGRSPAATKEVLDAIMAQTLPVSLSSKPDFSDEINLNTGWSQPRR